jgi:plasmid stabilization system protein ParE
MKLIWTDYALSDLDAIHEYIARDSAVYASRFLGRLVRAAEILEKYPEFGPVVPQFAGKQIRQLLFHNYRILYRIDVDRISIVTVVHVGRDLDLLEAKPWDVS